MDKRFVLFLVVSVSIVIGHTYVMSIFFPPKPLPAPKQGAVAEKQPDKQVDKRVAAKPVPAKPEQAEAKPAPAAKPAEVKAAAKKPAALEIPEKLVTLGSLDPTSPYRMLVTLTNRGAAVVRTELNDPKFRDIEDRGGYLGHLSLDGAQAAATAPEGGYRVEVVGPGTPAAVAGLKPGDVIVSLNDRPVTGVYGFHQLLHRISPRQKVTLKILREGKNLVVTVPLMRQPLAVVKPEGADPLSFLFTMYQVDGNKLGETERKQIDPRRELPGVNLRNGTWQVEVGGPDEVTFRRPLEQWGLEVVKTYRLERVPAESQRDATYPAYDLRLEVTVRNADTQPHKVSYQLDGPTGLPKEGYWYASKVNGTLRDVVVSFNQSAPRMVSSETIAAEKEPAPWEGEPISYIGVDAQYFASVLIPANDRVGDLWFQRAQAIRVGEIDENWKKNVDTSCRVVSTLHEIKPGKSLQQQYRIFAGPKRPALLARYGVDGLVDYGWFHWVAVPMVHMLHFFYAVFRNYGIAIILLTAVVRLCMFPLSRKQALGAQKMQELQPEIKRLQEKYKGDVEARTKAQQELFRKHNYNPLSGCLVVFIQLPIFVALYRSLMVDVELRQAPLLSEAIRWCSNLAGPDMLFDWSSFMPDWINSGVGMFGLGPYFNILPIITIVLFLWQQKKMMPPPTDEQSAMQQKIMKYMMVFMGIMFYKVASGLCLYFIASTLWGMAERKFLPKFSHPGALPPPTPPTPRRRR
jgi:YidC/Oxa1 family membrane protein insertase